MTPHATCFLIRRSLVCSSQEPTGFESVDRKAECEAGNSVRNQDLAEGCRRVDLKHMVGELAPSLPAQQVGIRIRARAAPFSAGRPSEGMPMVRIELGQSPARVFETAKVQVWGEGEWVGMTTRSYVRTSP